MSSSRTEIAERLTAALAAPRGEAKTADLERLVVHADAGDYLDLAFSARIALVREYHLTTEDVKALAPFAWCVATAKASPEAVDKVGRGNLRWQYKPVIGTMLDFPQISLEQIETIIDEMEATYRIDGQSLRAVHQRRYSLARHLGDDAAAERHYEAWAAAPRDGNCDCLACEAVNQIEWHADNARDSLVFELAEPILSGRIGCSRNPQKILAHVVSPYLRASRFDEARSAHLRGYEMIKHDRLERGLLRHHLVFCALTGNEGRGLDIVERHLTWSRTRASPLDSLDFAAAAVLVLNRVVALKHGDAPITAGGQVTTVAALVESLSAHALDLARRFDARNDNAAAETALHTVIATQPILAELPLSGAAIRARGISSVSQAGGRDTPTEALIAELDVLCSSHDIDDVLLTAQQLTDRASTLSGAQRAWASLANALQHRDVGDHTAAAEEFSRAATGLEAEREGVLAGLATLWQIVSESMATPASGADLSVGRKASDVLTPLLEDSRASNLTKVTAVAAAGEALAQSGSPSEAAAAMSQAFDLAEDDLARGVALRSQASVRLFAGEFDAAAQAAQAAHEHLARAGRPALGARACALGAIALAQGKRHADAIAAVEECLPLLPELRLRAKLNEVRGRALLALDQREEAGQALYESVLDLAATGQDAIAAPVRYTLGWIYLNTGRPGDAATVLEASLDAYDRTTTPLMAATARSLLTRALVLAGRQADALEPARIAYPVLRDAGRWELAAGVADRAGMGANAHGKHEEAATHFADAVECFQRAGAPVSALQAQLRQAQTTARIDLTTGRALFAEAMTRIEGLAGADSFSPSYYRGEWHYQLAWVLRLRGDHEEALQNTAAALDAFLECDRIRAQAQTCLLQSRVLLDLERKTAAADSAQRALDLLGGGANDSLVREAGELLARAASG